MNTTIFLSGIHGIGKTTICEKISQDLDMEHIIASNIIKQHEVFYKTNKCATDISDETDFFLRYMQDKTGGTRKMLLDAHFVLFDSQNNLVKVRKEIFSQLGIKSIVLLIDDVVNIQKRLKMRDNKDLDRDFLQQLQDSEIAYSREIAGLLGVEHRIFDISEIGQDNMEKTLLHYLG